MESSSEYPGLLTQPLLPTIRHEIIIVAGQHASHVKTGENCRCCRDENKERGNWSHPVESRLATVGFACGWGIFTRLPYFMSRNGGSAFLVPYVLALIAIVIPFAFVEMALGQFTSQGILTCWQLNPIFKGLGVAMLVLSSIFSVIIGVLQCYMLRYLGETLHSRATDQPLPWTLCDRARSTEYCVSLGTNLSHYRDSNHTYLRLRYPEERYFTNEVLGGEFIYNGDWSLGTLMVLNVAGLVVVWGVVALVLILGIKSLGKVSYVTASLMVILLIILLWVSYVTTSLMFILLIILLVRACTLPGGELGRSLMLSPDWSELANVITWYHAVRGAVFDYGVAFGGYLTLASYNKFHQTIVLDVVLVVVVNLAICLLCGVIVFSFYGFLSHQSDLKVDDIAYYGIVIFVHMPTMMSHLPETHLWHCIFFVFALLLSAGLMFCHVETIETAVVDQFPKMRRVRPSVSIVICLVGFLLSLPMLAKGGFSILVMVVYGIVTPLYVTAFVGVVLFTCYAATGSHPLVFRYDLGLMMGKTCGLIVFCVWSCLFGIGALLLLFSWVMWEIYKPDRSYAATSFAAPLLHIQRCTSAAPIVLMLITAFGVFLYKAITETAKKAFIPSKTWGPRLYIHRVLMLTYWSADRIDVGTEGVDPAPQAEVVPLTEITTV